MALKQCQENHNGWTCIPVYAASRKQVVLGSWPTLLIILFTPHLARSTWSWPVYGEMMFFPLPDYGPNSAHWNIQKFINVSVTNTISMFCNNKVAKVLRELFAFTHHEIFLV